MKNLARAFPLLLLAALTSAESRAHGRAGDRYFPPTIAVEDPFAANEFHVVAGRQPRASSRSARSRAYAVGIGWEPLEGVGVNLDGEYNKPNESLDPPGNGFSNLQLTLRKELRIDEAHEYAISAGVAIELGGTGSRGASRSVYTPTLYYAKGFGDLPVSQQWLRPFALTGVLAREIPADGAQPGRLNWGFTIQYSLLYLQRYVGDFGLKAPFDRLIAVVEFPVETCLDHGCSGRTSGTARPGFVWVGKSFNIAAEAVVPVNARSGNGIGFMLQFQTFFIDR